MNIRTLIALVVVIALFGLLPAVGAQPELPDVGGTIDDTTEGLESFLGGAEVVIAILVWAVTQTVKYFTKGDNGKSDISTTNIYMIVVAIFSVVYIFVNLAGYAEQLNEGVSFLTVIAGPLWQIIVSLVGSSLIYNTGRLTDNVVMAGKQGDKRRQFADPEPVSLSLGTPHTQHFTVYTLPEDAPDVTTAVMSQMNAAEAKG